MLIRELFLQNVTRNIPPVVYFHEQGPEKLALEVSEYIITGGWPDNHPNHRRVPNGIHEQYVHLLQTIAGDLDQLGGPELPNAWISGFYGSGKSSFAKLLGLSLDGMALPGGGSLAEALLKRDTSPRSTELRNAWAHLRQKIEPLGVVFDIGGSARDNEHIHSTAIRQIQRRLGYCSTQPLVADFELKLERDNEWSKFEAAALETLGKPWSAVKDTQMAEDDFSLVLSKLYPDRYPDSQTWLMSRIGTHVRNESPEEAVAAIRDMIHFRNPRATLFLVIDEVSQYVLSNRDRIDRLRAFATAIGATLKGKMWLLALGQQKLDEQADDSFLVWLKDRFPPRLRVHLANTNIRDVVHKRLLQKNQEHVAGLKKLFEDHRPDLKLYAYQCDNVTADEFVDYYPMLPGYIDLILQITSALRVRSNRAQGDDQAIRGLLQLLGELFRDQKLADMPVGSLVTLDKIYEVQHTALDSDIQASMARILNQCADDPTGLLVRVAKAVALLEQIQETTPTDAKLVAQCLYDQIDRGNHVTEIAEALEKLRRDNLLGYSEKQGYKVQSSAGEEWERERRDIGASLQEISKVVQEALVFLLGQPERPKLAGRPFPWSGRFSDGRDCNDQVLIDPRDDAAISIDFRFLTSQERNESTWVKRSDESAFQNRLVWVCGDLEAVQNKSREFIKSRDMVNRYSGRRGSLVAARKLLLQQEDINQEDLMKQVREEVEKAWMNGRFYFRARKIEPQEHGSTFTTALHACATRILPDLFPYIISTTITPAELVQLLQQELSGPSPKFLTDDLGILEMDSGRFVPACSGVVPVRIREKIEQDQGLAGSSLLSHFGGSPYAYSPEVVKACVAGLLRAGKVKIEPEGTPPITAVRDAGVQDLFEKDRAFRRATIYPAGDDDIGATARAKICRFFETRLHHPLDRENNAIADAVAKLFPGLADRLRDVLSRLTQLPSERASPPEFDRLRDALENCIRSIRQTEPTVKLVKRHLDVLNDGIGLLDLYHAELTPDAIRAVKHAIDVDQFQIAQLRAVGSLDTESEAAVLRISEHLKASKPWREITTLDDDLKSIHEVYLAERRRRLEWQEQQIELARSRIKSRSGFATLTADQAHQVLRSLAGAATDTTAEAVAPSLPELHDPFLLRLQRAEEEANERLDQILSEGAKPLVVKVDLGLRNREVATESEVETLVAEIRLRLIEQVQQGKRIRLV